MLPFARTTAALNAERLAGPAVVAWLAVALLACWAIWFFAVPVGVYERSASARIESALSTRPVVATVDGRVVDVVARFGQAVDAGTVMFVLESRADSLAHRAHREERASVAMQLESLAIERDAVEAMLRRGSAAGVEDVRSLEAMARAAAIDAEHAESEWNRASRLGESGGITPAQLEGLEAAARSARSRSAALEFSVRRSRSAMAGDEAAMRRQLAALDRQVAEVRGELSRVEEEVLQAEREIEDRRLRAPVSGQVAEIADIRAGAWVEGGDTLAVVAPAGAARIVAHFPMRDIGRVLPGQVARVRAAAFGGATFGTARATVYEVAADPNGVLRVDLQPVALRPGPLLLHGMPVEVDVRVERATPASLAFRRLRIR